uniref:TBC1 domain family member 4 n=1 Tax=Xenopus tropicalis TaxID=8364 RepID=A0A5S6K7X6_XENTR
MACHVFKANTPRQVSDIISSIRQVSKVALKEDSKPCRDSEDAFYNSQKFEVLYCGKVVIANKKAPSTLVDDCIEKFSQHERQRLKSLNEQQSAECSTDFSLAEIDVPGSPSDMFLEQDSENNFIPSSEHHSGMFTVGSQSNLIGSRVTFPERILEDSGFEDQQEFRTRCSSVTIHKRAQDNKIQPRRRHASAPSHVQPTDSEKNRTMLFQVGRFEINLISPDTKTVELEKNFKDISSCSQVEEVMLTLKQAFSTAAALQSAKTQIKLCEACPMHALHKLCERIEGLYPPRAKLVIQKQLSLLTDNEQADIFERVQKMKATSDQEENELVILHLRQLCETKQKTHVHIGENLPCNTVPENAAPSGRFKLDILKNKAKKSLTSSLENIFSRGTNKMRGRLGSMDSFERCNSFTSDKDGSPGDSPPATPPSSPVSSSCPPFPEEDPDSPKVRRRAHTFSHPTSSGKRRITFPDSKSPSARFPLQRQNSLHCSARGRRRTFSSCSNDSLNASGSCLIPHRISWRQRIFLRVASPMTNSLSDMQHKGQLDVNDLLPLSPLPPAMEEDPLAALQAEDSALQSEGKRSSEDFQNLWKKAIHQQILLLRMEKENMKLEASRDELQSRKVKLDYEEVGLCQKEVLNLWDKKLNCRTKIRFDMEEIFATLKEGVPKGKRGEIWQFLSVQYRLRHRLPSKQQPSDVSYNDLLKQLTAQQHAILVDLGRTFPTHPYFSAQLGAGQLSLYNLLKAYSLLDKEVGYCQGISFVAGVLLLHMSEQQAFEMLKFLMYDLGFRKQYRPDMMSLQIQMYQLSRLLHDYHRDLYNHLEENEINPSLYAAPWFLTLFASQFPLGFVARVFDIIFLQGTEVIFKVALCLLSNSEALIMARDSFESIVDFLKSMIPEMTNETMEKIITQVFEMDISKQLHAYEVEYHVINDEMLEASIPSDDNESFHKLEKSNNQLKRQNMDLLEKLQVAHTKIQSLESNVENILSRENKLRNVVRSMEEERSAYQNVFELMKKYVPTNVLTDCELLLKNTTCSPNNRTKAGNKQ